MLKPQVSLLTKEDVVKFWTRIEWRLDATSSLRRFYTKEDMQTLIAEDRMQVWTAGADLVLITMVVATPVGNILQIVWAHGTGLMTHFAELQEKFNLYAYMTKCQKIEVIGRSGWSRRLRQVAGFRIEYIAYSADVIKPRMN